MRKKLSDETKAKMSKAHKGKKLSEETKQRIRDGVIANIAKRRKESEVSVKESGVSKKSSK